MCNKFQCLKEDVKTTEPRIIILSSILDDELSEYLNDDFNFEITLRLLNLKEQLKIRSINNLDVRKKQLISKVFKKVCINYMLYFMNGEREEFDLSNEIKFKYNDLGKPFLDDQKQYHFQFSDSSSNKVFVMVFELNSDTPIGVDLSHSKQDSISDTLFQEQFRPIFDRSEIEQLNNIPNNENRYVTFNQLWTLKEAFTKLLGSGLNIDLSKFFFNINNNYVYNCPSIPINFEAIINEVKVDWYSSIDIDIHKLIEDRNIFVENLSSKEIYCRSAVFFGQDNLPVIISIINQKFFEPLNIKTYCINLRTVIREQIHN